MPNKGKRVSMRVVHRHHFSSALKRMSAVVSVQNPGSSSTEYIVTVKGAPETLRSMVSKSYVAVLCIQCMFPRNRRNEKNMFSQRKIITGCGTT